MYKGCRVAGLQSCRVAGLQGCRVAGLQGCRVAGLHGVLCDFATLRLCPFATLPLCPIIKSNCRFVNNYPRQLTRLTTDHWLSLASRHLHGCIERFFVYPVDSATLGIVNAAIVNALGNRQSYSRCRRCFCDRFKSVPNDVYSGGIPCWFMTR